jgi:hypothetical protein
VSTCSRRSSALIRGTGGEGLRAAMVDMLSVDYLA